MFFLHNNNKNNLNVQDRPADGAPVLADDTQQPGQPLDLHLVQQEHTFQERIWGKQAITPSNVKINWTYKILMSNFRNDIFRTTPPPKHKIQKNPSSQSVILDLKNVVFRDKNCSTDPSFIDNVTVLWKLIPNNMNCA